MTQENSQKNDEILVGIDIGGTFCDAIIVRNGKVTQRKVLSSAGNPADAVLGLLQSIRADTDETILLSHGSTVATNALLERKCARVALITTRGFKDIIHIGRQKRPGLYDPTLVKNPHLVDDRGCFELDERIDSAGKVLESPQRTDLEFLKGELQTFLPESIAVSFLFSFRNPVHEHIVHDFLTQHFSCPVSISSNVSPSIREYERTSTTVVNAALKPLVTKYLSHIDDRLTDYGISTFRVMQSNGGVNSVEAIIDQPVQMILSGPAGGVSACRNLSKLTGEPNVIGLDMGGTSTDVSMIVDGQSILKEESTIDGIPIQIAMLDIQTIGAGGGSIAWIDSGGLMKVGPQSAGSDPGPICYDRGGKELTVSDAHVILGRLPATQAIGEHLVLNEKKAADVARDYCRKLNVSLEKGLTGIIDVVNVTMLGALNVISSKRGLDPRDFKLVAFGGAGPLHGPLLARELGIEEVIIPPAAGLFSALGLIQSDVVQDYFQSVMVSLEKENWEQLCRYGFEGLSEKAGPFYRREHVEKELIEKSHFIYLKYKGQDRGIPVAMRNNAAEMIEHFKREHLLRNGYNLDYHAIECVGLQLRLTIPSRTISVNPGKSDRVVMSSHTIFDADRRVWEKIPLYFRETFPDNFSCAGPSVILEHGATTWVPHGMIVIKDSWGNLRIRRDRS